MNPIRRKRDYLKSVFSPADYIGKGPLFEFNDSLLGEVDKSHYSFLDRFNHDDMERILKKIGLFDHLSVIGFKNVVFEIFRDEDNIHYFRLYSGTIDPSNLLIDLRLSEGKFTPLEQKVKSAQQSYDMFVIEWLQSQNPFVKKFNPERPQLPGQKLPGLGCLKYLIGMMQFVSGELTRDGFLDVPDHFHLGVMYSVSFKFFNPEREGETRALLRDLEGYSLSDITWGVITSEIYDKKTGSPFIYQPSEEIFAVSDRMSRYFRSPSYQKIVREMLKLKKYELNYEVMSKKKKAMLKNKDISEI